MEFSHIDKKGEATMVDISHKPRVKRRASAFARVSLKAETVELIRSNLMEKGDVLSVARIAGISAAKKTSELIPLCHNIAIDQVTVDFTLKHDAIEIKSSALCTDKTGIEMEALTAVSLAALTIYDMCKAVDKSMVISNIRLLAKTKEETT